MLQYCLPPTCCILLNRCHYVSPDITTIIIIIVVIIIAQPSVKSCTRCGSSGWSPGGAVRSVCGSDESAEGGGSRGRAAVPQTHSQSTFPEGTDVQCLSCPGNDTSGGGPARFSGIVYHIVARIWFVVFVLSDVAVLI